MKKFLHILANTLPVLLMIALIPLVRKDFWPSVLDIGIILIALAIKYEKKDVPILWGYALCS